MILTFFSGIVLSGRIEAGEEARNKGGGSRTGWNHGAVGWKREALEGAQRPGDGDQCDSARLSKNDRRLKSGWDGEDESANPRQFGRTIKPDAGPIVLSPAAEAPNDPTRLSPSRLDSLVSLPRWRFDFLVVASVLLTWFACKLVWIRFRRIPPPIRSEPDLRGQE
jgi:hypothetical protein